LETILVIINPNAGKRRGNKDWPLINRLLSEAGLKFHHMFTEGVMDACRFAKEAAEQGVQHIITVGGDGTLNEVANGILQHSIANAKDITLSLIPIGTGDDWARNYGVPADYPGAVEVIARGKTVLQDAGWVSYNSRGGFTERYFVNSAGVGFDAEVVFDTNARKEQGSVGKIAYLWSMLKAMFRYVAREVRINIDGKNVFDGKLYSANIGVCRYSGGGMQQVPMAVPDDGLLDITIIRNVGKTKVIRNVKGLYDGSFIKMDEVATHRGTHISIESPEGLLLEADGESLGRPPYEFRIFPLVLKVKVPLSYIPLR